MVIPAIPDIPSTLDASGAPGLPTPGGHTRQEPTVSPWFICAFSTGVSAKADGTASENDALWPPKVNVSNIANKPIIIFFFMFILLPSCWTSTISAKYSPGIDRRMWLESRLKRIMKVFLACGIMHLAIPALMKSV